MSGSLGQLQVQRVRSGRAGGGLGRRQVRSRALPRAALAALPKTRDRPRPLLRRLHQDPFIFLIYFDFDFFPLFKREGTVSSDLRRDVDEKLVVFFSAGFSGPVDEPASAFIHQFGSTIWYQIEGDIQVSEHQFVLPKSFIAPWSINDAEVEGRSRVFRGRSRLPKKVVKKRKNKKDNRVRDRNFRRG